MSAKPFHLEISFTRLTNGFSCDRAGMETCMHRDDADAVNRLING